MSDTKETLEKWQALTKEGLEITQEMDKLGRRLQQLTAELKRLKNGPAKPKKMQRMAEIADEAVKLNARMEGLKARYDELMAQGEALKGGSQAEKPQESAPRAGQAEPTAIPRCPHCGGDVTEVCTNVGQGMANTLARQTIEVLTPLEVSLRAAHEAISTTLAGFQGVLLATTPTRKDGHDA